MNFLIIVFLLSVSEKVEKNKREALDKAIFMNFSDEGKIAEIAIKNYL